MKNFTDNITTTTTPFKSKMLNEKQCILGSTEMIQLVLYAFVIIIGVVGNASICYCFGLFHKSSRKTVSEVLILYLAAVDFCASIFTPFVFIYWIATCNTEWHFGTFGCKVIPFLGRVFINISVGIICILAFDRYRAICSPFKGQFRKKHIHFFVLLATILAALCEVYYLEALTYHKNPLPRGSTGCLVTPKNKLQYIEITSSILLARDAFFVLMFTYTSVRIVLSLRRRNGYVTSKNSSTDNASRREMEHVIRVIIVMQIVFIVLVLPRDFLHIIYSLSWIDNDGIPYSKEVIRLNEALKVIQTANSCANVFIYAKMHDRFRSRVLDLLKIPFTCGTIKKLALMDEKNDVTTYDTAYNISDNNNRQYTRSLLRNKKSLRPGSFVTGDTIITHLEPSPAMTNQRKQFLLVEYSAAKPSMPV